MFAIASRERLRCAIIDAGDRHNFLPRRIRCEPIPVARHQVLQRLEMRFEFDVSRPRLVRDHPRRRRTDGLQRPHPRAGAGHPARARRPRRRGRRRHGNRQDDRVRTARHRAHRPREEARVAARAGREPHARARLADRRRLHAAGEAGSGLQRGHRGGRRALQGPAVRSSRAACDILVATPGRLHRPHGTRRREARATWRSSCSTRPTACSTWASGPA